MLESLAVLTDVILQTAVNIDIDIEGPSGLAGGAVGAFLTTLIIGAILVSVAPQYTERKMAAVFEDPVQAFIYGFIALILLALIVFVLVITLIGILVAIPLIVLGYLVWAVGATIAFLAIGDRLVGRDDGWGKPLLVAAAINGGLALTGVGGILSFIIGAIGFGTILGDYF